MRYLASPATLQLPLVIIVVVGKDFATQLDPIIQSANAANVIEKKARNWRNAGCTSTRRDRCHENEMEWNQDRRPSRSDRTASIGIAIHSEIWRFQMSSTKEDQLWFRDQQRNQEIRHQKELHQCCQWSNNWRIAPNNKGTLFVAVHPDFLKLVDAVPSESEHIDLGPQLKTGRQ